MFPFKVINLATMSKLSENQAELQTCGGASDISGRCADGLQCLKTCRKFSLSSSTTAFPISMMSNYFPVPCKTVGDRGRPCVFPFKYNPISDQDDDDDD